MQKKIIQAGLQGMNQDVINPNINSKQAYEIKNFRINATVNSNSIELTSEKGTLRVDIYDDIDGVSFDSITKFIQGYPDYSGYTYPYENYTFNIVGYCVLN